MLESALVSFAIISQVLQVSVAEAVQAHEQVQIVPTKVEDEEVWQVQPTALPYAEVEPPTLTGSPLGPDFQAKAGIIMDAQTQQILWQQNPDYVLSMASITKLMTALTWLDYQPAAGFDHVHTFTPDQDTIGGKELNLGYGEQLTARDLLRTAMVSSDNDTALGLVATTGRTEAEFVELMNQKAHSIGLTTARFTDATGLDDGNMASAADVAKMALYAFRQDAIREPAGQKTHEQRTLETDRFSRVYTTNDLLYDGSLDIVAGKTGYTQTAGYCLVVQAREPETGREVIAVTLGAPTDSGRFSETKKLLEWAYENYTWPQ